MAHSFGANETQDGVTGTSSKARGVVGRSDEQVGVIGISKKFVGVWGESTAESQPGVFGTSTTWQGVHGKSVAQAGVTGDSDHFVGVWGESKGEGHPGVFGKSAQGPGVRGFHGDQQGDVDFNDRKVGVLGQSQGDGTGVVGKSNGGVGVRAVSVGSPTRGAALQVDNAGDFSAVLIFQEGSGRFIVCRAPQNRDVFEVMNSGEVHAVGDVKVRGVALTCDRNAKASLTSVDARQILEKLADLPIQNWSYKTDPASVRHIGPTSQDFQAAFGLNGDDDVHISAVDAQGIALAAIQGLNEKLQAQNAGLRTSLASLEARLAALESMAQRPAEPSPA